MTHLDDTYTVISPSVIRSAHLWTIVFHVILGMILYWNAGSESRTRLGAGVLIFVSLLALFPIVSRQYHVKMYQ
jgi:hypothetical protein